MDMGWVDDIRARFPDWGTDAAQVRWPTIRVQLKLGQSVRGEVIARVHFGVWLDIGVDFPALLLVPNMAGARERGISFEEYPAIGTVLNAQIIWLYDRGEISLTQHPMQ